MTTTVPLLRREQISRLPKRAREIVEYRKSSLSLNHIQGCPLDCAYCIRHTYGLWDQRQPRALMTMVQPTPETWGAMLALARLRRAGHAPAPQHDHHGRGDTHPLVRAYVLPPEELQHAFFVGKLKEASR